MSKPDTRFAALFYRWFGFLFKKRSGEAESSPEAGAGRYFALMLGEYLNRFGSRDNTVDNGSVRGEETELDSNPLLDMLKKKSREAEKQDAHESPEGEVRGIWSEGESGGELSENEGGGKGGFADTQDCGDSMQGEGGGKLGHTNQHSRISAKLNSVVSEGAVPEHVVFNEIGEATHIFDWRRILRPNGSFDVDWSYRNAVVEDGIVRPALETIPVAVTEILLDTSGSIDEPLLKRFLQECRNILPYSEVKIGCFDTQFYGFTAIKSLADLENMVFEGRHGTSFSAAVNAFSGRADNRIIFTDGEAPMPAQRMDIIWIVFGGKRIQPNGGRVFYVDDDLLKRMKE